MFTRKFDSIETRNAWIKTNSKTHKIIRIYDAICYTEDGDSYTLPAIDAHYIPTMAMEGK